MAHQRTGIKEPFLPQEARLLLHVLHLHRTQGLNPIFLYLCVWCAWHPLIQPILDPS